MGQLVVVYNAHGVEYIELSTLRLHEQSHVKTLHLKAIGIL